MRRTLAAAALPAAAVAVSWIRLEDAGMVSDQALIVLLALASACFPGWLSRWLAVAVAALAMTWIAFGSEPWELLPFRDERVVRPLLETADNGIGDYYALVLPFDPARQAEMHALLLVAVFGFVLAIGLLVAARRPLGAAAVTVAGVGWPATLLGGGAVAIGALALAAALSIPLFLRARSVPAVAVGSAAAALIVAGSAWASSATSFTRDAVLDWQSWDFRGASAQSVGVRFVWDAQYDGIRFPPTKTTVLRIAGTERAQYWRASTLEAFFADRWYEDLSLVVLREASGPLVPDPLAPPNARNEQQWLEQRVEVKALVDDRLVAAGTPVSVDAPSLGTVFSFAGGVVRARHALTRGTRYRIWSYVADPAPSALASAPVRYPAATRRFLNVWGRSLPAYGTPSRARRVAALLDDPSYSDFGAYRPLYEQARRLTFGARSPYAAVLALESWFRQRGGFEYDEQPPLSNRPPLVHFVTSSRAGYCQHFAGAMAVMARLLGIPARIAVGFTSGQYEEGAWTVSDHNAHAWVEVWFPNYGWVPFDPTPGRGRFSTAYSFASDSPATLDALRRGGLNPLVRTDSGETAKLLDGLAADGAGGDDPPSIFAIALLIGALGGAVIGMVKMTVRKLRYLTVDPRRAATASRRELEAFLRDQGIPVPASMTLDDLQEAVADELGLDGSAFVEAAGRGRFGAPGDARRAARIARSELRALLKRARGELSVWARLRGFVSLRSLRSWQG
jgi:transglutaminase superfamily protein